MSCHTRVDEWPTIIRTQLPLLRKPQATVLALWSLGMVLARSCALSAGSVWLATWLGRQENTVRQQLRERCYDAAAKQGVQRQRWPWNRASCRCCAGCSVAGRARNWPWPWTPPCWGRALRCWRSAWSMGAVRSPSPGPSCPPLPSMPGGAPGCACCASCVPPSHGPGRSSCWPIAGCRRAGCVGVSCGWAGSRSCASMRRGPFARRASAGLSPCAALCLSRAAAGGGPARPSNAPPGAWRAPCWPAGTRATRRPGSF